MRRPRYRHQKNTATPFTGRRSHFCIQQGDNRCYCRLVRGIQTESGFTKVSASRAGKPLKKPSVISKKTTPTSSSNADAKRGDIGNTSEMYARSFSNISNTDSVTVSSYMGEDSVKPFLNYPGHWVIVLGLTSNKGSQDFQFTTDNNGERLFEKVLRVTQNWATDDQLMFVVGATQGKLFTDVRRIAPDHFLLVPGVGAQGGSLQEVARYGMNDRCGLLVNSSRGIIYADKSESFADAARREAEKIQQEMETLLMQKGLI